MPLHRFLFQIFHFILLSILSCSNLQGAKIVGIVGISRHNKDLKILMRVIREVQYFLEKYKKLIIF